MKTKFLEEYYPYEKIEQVKEKINKLSHCENGYEKILHHSIIIQSKYAIRIDKGLYTPVDDLSIKYNKRLNDLNTININHLNEDEYSKFEYCSALYYIMKNLIDNDVLCFLELKIKDEKVNDEYKLAYRYYTLLIEFFLRETDELISHFEANIDKMYAEKLLYLVKKTNK